MQPESHKVNEYLMSTLLCIFICYYSLVLIRVEVLIILKYYEQINEIPLLHFWDVKYEIVGNGAITNLV